MPVFRYFKIFFQGLSLFRLRRLVYETQSFINIVRRAQINGTALVNRFRNNIQNWYSPCRCFSSSLFDQERHRVALIQQSKLKRRSKKTKFNYLVHTPQYSVAYLARWALRSGWIQENSTIFNCSMDISYHATNVSANTN